MKWAAALLGLLLAACSAQPADPAPQAPAAQPEPSRLQEAAASSSSAITPVVAAAIESLAPSTPPEPPAPSNAQCRKLAAGLIARWEITSPSYYESRLRGVIWPKGASGLTWCIGYDGGHQTRVVILDDWQAHAQAERLGQTAGITGARAGQLLPQYRDITTPYPDCYQVFEERSLVEYERRTARAFRVDLAELPPGVCSSLVSAVYNRGASMTGDSRREMVEIRDQCLPARSWECVAAALRSMCRLWRGTVNERGLCARRDMEASYATGDLP